MTRQTQLASDLWPLILPRLERWARELGDSGGASGSVEVTFTGTIGNDQAPQFLLRDGTRSVQGNMAVDTGVTIDGVDISAHAADAAAHHAPATAGDGIGLSGQQVAVDLATNPGLEFDAAKLRVRVVTGGGIQRAATGVEVDSTVVRTTRTLTAGNGLTGGGDLSADRTFTVGAGTLISVAATTVGIAAGANHQFIGTGTGTAAAWRNMSTLAGTGLTHTASVLAVDQAFSPTWTGTHTFNLQPTIAANLRFTGARSIITDSNNALTLAPAGSGDLVLNPGGVAKMAAAKSFRSDVHTPAFTGIAGFDVSDRGGNFYQMTIGGLKVDELYAKTFVADETRVDRGAEFWSKSYGVVESDFTLPALESTVDVWFEDAAALTGDIFSTNDWLLLRGIEWGTSLTLYMVWFQITARVTASSGGRQQWRLRRKSGGTTGQVITARSIMIDVGVAGQGTIELSALVQDKGPFIRMGNWATNPYTPANWTHCVQMGHLDGVAGYGAGKWGFAAGKSLGATASAFEGVLIEATDGAVLRNTAFEMYSGGNSWLSIDNSDGMRFRLNESSITTRNRIFWDAGASTDYGRIAFTKTASQSILQLDAADATEGRGAFTAAGPVNFARVQLFSGTLDTGPSNAPNVNISASGNYGFVKIMGDRLIAANGQAAEVRATALSATQIAFVVQGAASQSAALQEWRDNAGGFLAGISNLGGLKCCVISNISSNSFVTVAGNRPGAILLLPNISGGTTYGLVAIRSGGLLTKMIDSAGFLDTIDNTVLTGATGGVNRVTVSHTGGYWYIENRLGYAINYKYLLFD